MVLAHNADQYTRYADCTDKAHEACKREGHTNGEHTLHFSVLLAWPEASWPCLRSRLTPTSNHAQVRGAWLFMAVAPNTGYAGQVAYQARPSRVSKASAAAGPQEPAG